MEPRLSIAVVALTLVLPATGSAQGGEPVGLPAAVPGLGVTAEGMAAADGGPCAGTLELEIQGARDGCTHGADPAPSAVGDVREPRTVRRLRAAASASDSAAPRVSASGAVACHGDGTSGNRVQAVYARVEGGPDRYSKILPLIRGWAADVSSVFYYSARRTGGSLVPRWVTTPDCRLEVASATVSARAARDHGRFVQELTAQGFSKPYRKYLVWADTNELCGIAEQYLDDAKGATNAHNGPSDVPGMVARIDNGCWGLLDAGEASLEVHELTHTLGGVQGSAPHASSGGHCFDEWDALCYDDEPPYEDGTIVGALSGQLQRLIFPSGCSRQSSEPLLDCGGDDYFNTSPAPGTYLALYWNVADSTFLTASASTPGPLSPPAPSGDRQPPRTKIVGGPKRRSSRRRARVRFRADEPASFKCRLDDGKWGECASPFRTGRLAYGPHRFRVLARDTAGNEQGRPVYWPFRIAR